MAIDRRTAIITGGASGMGLAVAHALANAGGWDITIIDLNPSAGAQAVEVINNSSSSSSSSSSNTSSTSPCATFHQANCIEYPALAGAFEATFARTHRLDFVFANAGIAERGDFYAPHTTAEDNLAPPPPYDLLVSKILLDAVYMTAYLAQHYFRQTPDSLPGLDGEAGGTGGGGGGGGKSIVMTASSGGIYPSGMCPLYTAAKHGVVGFMRAIAPSFYKNDGIRVNAICPGPLRTGLLPDAQWDLFPPEQMTDVNKVAAVVMMLIEGKDSVPATETRIDGEGMDRGGKDPLWGNAVEISAQRHYYRDAPRWSDETMEKNMLACDPTLSK